MSKSTAPAFVTMTFDKWVETFSPITNTTTVNAPFDGCMYETYGADLAVVTKRAANINAAASRKVWTVVENDAGDRIVVDGYHRVNRMGYFITAVPAGAGTQYEVTID
jgi:hypothetical protein